MTVAYKNQGVMERLPPARGTYRQCAPLNDLIWFRVGGPAEVLFTPTDDHDLAAFLENCPLDIPLTMLGAGSNLLVREGGVGGVVIRLGRGFAGIRAVAETLVVGAATADVKIALAAQQAGLGGFEFLRGIPGTIGGALRMNAGAHGGEMADIVIRVTALDRQGVRHEIDVTALGFGYRSCAVAEDWIFISAVLSGVPTDPQVIRNNMQNVIDHRLQAQPVQARTGGSTFKNPSATDPGLRSAWEYIDAAGCRGLSIGDAQVSEHHCNFLINRGHATASDLEDLGEEVRRRVQQLTGVVLDWEIKRIGRPSSARDANAVVQPAHNCLTGGRP